MYNYDDLESYKRKRKIRKIIRTIVIIFVVIVSIFVLYYIENQLQSPSSDNVHISKKSSGFPITVPGDELISVETMANSIVLVTKNKINFYSELGVLVSSHDHNYNNPSVVTTSKTVVLFERGGQGFKVFSRNKLLYENTSENKIVDLQVSETGYIALICNEERYYGSVKIYDTEYNEVLTWYSSEYYINSVAFRPDNKGCYISGMNVYSGKYDSIIYEINFDKKSEVFSKLVEDTLILSIKYNGENIMAIGDNMMAVYSNKGEQLKKYHYNSKLSLYHYSDSNLLLYFNDNNSVSKEVVIFNSSGNFLKKVHVKDNIKDMVYYNKKLIALFERSISVYNSNFDHIKTISLDSGAFQIKVVGSYAYYMSKLELNKVKIN